MKHRNHSILYKSRLAAHLAIAALAAYSTGCSAAAPRGDTVPVAGMPPQDLSPATAVAPTETPFLNPTPSIFTPTPAGLPASTWKEGWVDFVNGYYGYAISLPPSAVVTVHDGIQSIPEEALIPIPEDVKETKSPFDRLNRTYPPGICVGIEYEFTMIQIRVADWLGGIYADQCGLPGGIGAGNWVWTEAELAVGGEVYPTTVLSLYESDAPDAILTSQLYMVDLGDGARLSTNGDVSDPVLLDILRSYRPVPRTERYCPEPVPARLEAGTYGYVSSDPLLAPNNVRSEPGINQALTGSIAPGTVVELLEGPVCNNSLQWWKISIPEAGLTGWTPEGDAESAWLIGCESRENCGPP